MLMKRVIEKVMGPAPRIALAAATCALLAACGDGATSGSGGNEPVPPIEPGEPTDPGGGTDKAHYILAPGNSGRLPANPNTLDQLPLYDGLTALRGDVGPTDIDRYFLPMDFAPIGGATVIDTGREGLSIVSDEYGIFHIEGETNEDVAFGAGWITVQNDELLITFGRYPARAACIDIPGVNAFALVTSATPYRPSPETEAHISAMAERIRRELPEGEAIIAEAQAYADGANAYLAAHPEVALEPFTVNDVIAVTCFIGSIFGAGGGGEAENAHFLAQLQNRLGADRGRDVWEDLLRTDDPEAPKTLEKRFDYGTFTGGAVTGSVVLDEGSILSLDARNPQAGSGPALPSSIFVDASAEPPGRQASNWLIAHPDASASGNPLAVQGPQLGYYLPAIVKMMHMKTPDWEFQGISVPGLSLYGLIGRTADYAWSLTSANQDVRDVYVEILCDPEGGTPTRTSRHYLFNDECIEFESFDAGVIGDTPILYPVSLHGPVIGTATVAGEPVALARKRSTFGFDGHNLAALRAMTQGEARTPERFFEAANKFGFTFNWGYANRDTIAYFGSGRLPARPPGLDRRLPTIGTGEYEWEGLLLLEEHPHATGHPSGRFLNWNNQAAPGWMHGDSTLFGAHHRVELFDKWPARAELHDVVGIMNRAATEDTNSPVWEVVLRKLECSEAPTPLAAEVVGILHQWVDEDAPLLDADEDGNYDHPGAMIARNLWGDVQGAVLDPVLGPVTADGVRLRGIDRASIVDKDLRSNMGEDVKGPFRVAYCGAGDAAQCCEDLWMAIATRSDELAAGNGDDPSEWRTEGRRTGFAPGLIAETFRATNRPTYQHVIEFARNPD